MSDISSTGFWLDDSKEHHTFDEALAAELVSLFQSKAVVDLGCGPGSYVSALRQAGVDCDGYDGNPNTESLSEGLCKIQDLSVPFELERMYDWVLSLEVGEHIPQQFEAVLLDNILRHAREGVVLSWGLPGQKGWGHVNLRENRYIKNYFRSRGFTNDVAVEQSLRDKSSLVWFKGTLMVFRRNGPNSATTAGPGGSGERSSLIADRESSNDAWREELTDMVKQLQRSFGDTYWLLLMQRIREIVQSSVPPGAVVLIVGQCDDELMILPGRHTRPFPQGPDGEYAAWHPLRGAEVVAHLKLLRDNGADFILFPATSLWWLEHYKELRTYLATECRPVFQAKSTCMLFALGDN
jgi:SAM-dependent methyltransferase